MWRRAGRAGAVSTARDRRLPGQTSDDRFYAELTTGRRAGRSGRGLDRLAGCPGGGDDRAARTRGRTARAGIPEIRRLARGATTRTAAGLRRVSTPHSTGPSPTTGSHACRLTTRSASPHSTSRATGPAEPACRSGETSKSRLPAFLSEGIGEHTHRADEDAARQAEMFKRMRAWRTFG